MIEIIQTPDINRVLADGNDTEVIVRSLRGEDYYFRVDIYVNNELILPQSWSKDHQGLARYNLKLLYYAYFKNTFYIPDYVGFDYQVELYKKVRIEISEVAIKTGIVIEKMILPEFYIIKNRVPQKFDDTISIAILDMDTDTAIKAPKDGFITIPVFIQEAVDVSIKTGQEETIFNEEYPANTTKIARFVLPLGRIPIPENESIIFVELTAGDTTIRKKVSIIKDTVFNSTHLFYENNFGMYISTYLTGKLEIDHKLKPKSYKQQDGNTISYAVENDINISVNTGYGYSNELAYKLSSAIDVRVLIENTWERVAAATKKVKRYESNSFIYAETIKLTKINLPKHDNNNTFNQPPIASGITIDGIENQNSVIPIQLFKDVFVDASELKTITLYQSTVHGSLSFKKSNGQSFTLFYPSSNIDVPKVIHIEDIVSLQYNPFSERFGTPLETINFSMGDGVYNSNVVQLTINIEEAIASPIPPSVVLEDIYIIPINDVGFGGLTIPINVVNPDGFPTEVVWLENNSKISLIDTSNTQGTVLLSAANDEEEFFVILRTTDSRGLFTESTINIKTANKIIRARIVDGLTGPNQVVYLLQIRNGIPGKSLDITFGLVTANIGQYARVDVLNPDQEQLLNAIFREVTITKTFNSEGIIRVNFLMFGIDEFGMQMTISFSNIDAGMTMNLLDNPLTVIP